MNINHPNAKKGTFHLDDALYENLLPLIGRTKKMDKDNVFLVCGDPGNGKSTIASQVLYVLDPTIVHDMNIFSDTDEYIEYCLQLGKKNVSGNKSAQHDEARDTGGINVNKKKIRRFWNFMYENRFLNMNHALVQSDFFKVPRDVVYHRARFLIFVKEDKKWKNGTYYFFGRYHMKKLYERGKRFKNLEITGHSFKGYFVDFWAGNPDYLNIKAKNFFEKYKDDEDKKELTLKQVLPFIWKRSYHDPDYSHKDLIRVLKMDESYYFQLKKDWEQGYLDKKIKSMPEDD